MAIATMTGYPIPEQPAPIHVVPQQTLQQMVCVGPCNIRAFYLPGRGVFINEQLDFANDLVARSVLLHELVHHAQELSGRFNRIADRCHRWYVREREAYDIQNAYLQQKGSATRFVLDTFPGMCGREGEIKASPQTGD